MLQGDRAGLHPRKLTRDRNLERIIVFSLGYFLKDNTSHETNTTKLKHHDLLQQHVRVRIFIFSSASSKLFCLRSHLTLKLVKTFLLPRCFKHVKTYSGKSH